MKTELGKKLVALGGKIEAAILALEAAKKELEELTKKDNK